MGHDNTCLMPGEMGRTPPTVTGKTADEIITEGQGYNALKGRRMSINTGHTPPVTTSKIPKIECKNGFVDIKKDAIEDRPGDEHSDYHIIKGPGTYISREGGTASVREFIESDCLWVGNYTFEDTSYDWQWFPCGRCHSDGPEDRDIIKLDDRGPQGTIGNTNSSKGNTPGGPAREPAPPPPGVEAEGCQCGCCDGEDEQPITQSPPPTLPYRVVTDFPERLFELLQDSAEGMGVEVETFVRFAVDDYIRRRRN